MENTSLASLTIEDLSNQIAQLKQENATLKAQLVWFTEQNRLKQSMLFGQSSDQVPANQMNLFNEAEAEAKPEAREPDMEVIETYRRRKQVGQREEDLENLPVETIDYRLSEEEQVCCACGEHLHEMSTEVRQELKIIPAQVKVVKHIRHVYACRNCDKNADKTPVITAPMPRPLIAGSLASPTAAAYIMDQKFVQGMPLYRQEKQFERLGLSLSRQTMARWMIKCVELWLNHLYDRMHYHLVRRDILHADETTLQVLKEPDRKAESTSYMWVYRTGRDGPPIILFEYQPTRAGRHARNFLQGFNGYLQADAYGGYHAVPNVVLVGCWAHARRGFTDALKVLLPGMESVGVIAKEGLHYCNQLFDIERSLENSTAEERYSERLKQSEPVLNAFSAWLKHQAPRVMPKSALGQAIQYCRNQWEPLTAFLKDGRTEIHNNRCERSIKLFVIGRKNWLFANTPDGADSSSVIYSIVETAKENKLNPYIYLTYVFEKLPNVDVTDPLIIDSLLPWSPSIPEQCRISD